MPGIVLLPAFFRSAFLLMTPTESKQAVKTSGRDGPEECVSTDPIIQKQKCMN